MLEEAHLACFPPLVASDAILVGLTRCCKNHGAPQVSDDLDRQDPVVGAR